MSWTEASPLAGREISPGHDGVQAAISSVWMVDSPAQTLNPLHSRRVVVAVTMTPGLAAQVLTAK
jgi:hypothetical protein